MSIRRINTLLQHFSTFKVSVRFFHFNSFLMALNQTRPVPLPVPGERNLLITSALPYVNNEPHLGNIIGCVLSADAFARYARLRGYNTIYVCGTDEYGTATETKALEEGISCQALCDKYHALHKSIYEHFEIEFDYFGRTTTSKQTEIAQDIFLKLHQNQQLNEATMTQLYCEHCSRYLSDRYVEGICPHCHYPDARGDQCDGCQKLLNAVDLIQPRCKRDGKTPIQKESNHLFLNLPELQPKLTHFIQTSSLKGHWSPNALSVTKAWLKEGLKPRCITRDLIWGTPVPLSSFKEKVFYVWFDAPIGYLSITANLTPQWEQWWKNPEHVQLYQFMGKDNTPFHTVIFPSSLLGTNESWTLLHHVNTTEYLTYEGDKFSKSRQKGVFGSHVKQTGIPISIWRYYLFMNRPETSDSDFQWHEFIVRSNSELLNNLGNFMNRIMKFVCSDKYQGHVPSFQFNSSAEDQVFVTDIEQLLRQVEEAMEQVKLRLGLQLVMAMSARGNQYLQEHKLDTRLFLETPERCANVVGHALNLVALLAPLISPFMPSIAKDMVHQLNIQLGSFPTHFEQRIVSHHVLNTPKHLFQKLDESLAITLRHQFSGSSNSSSSTPLENGSTPFKATNAKKSSKASNAKVMDPVKLFETLSKEQQTDALHFKYSQVQTQSAKVRSLKAAKADKLDIDTEVQSLLQFKQDLLNELNLISSSTISTNKTNKTE